MMVYPVTDGLNERMKERARKLECMFFGLIFTYLLQKRNRRISSGEVREANLPNDHYYGETDGCPPQGSVGTSHVPKRNMSAKYSAD